MGWNEEPMGPSAPGFMRLAGQVPGFLSAAAQGFRSLQQARPEDVLTPEVLDADAARRDLRMYNARKQYESRYGQGPMTAGMQRNTSEGMDPDALLRRIQLAQQLHRRR